MGSMASAAIKEVLKCQKSHVAEECVKCDKDEDKEPHRTRRRRIKSCNDSPSCGHAGPTLMHHPFGDTTKLKLSIWWAWGKPYPNPQVGDTACNHNKLKIY